MGRHHTMQFSRKFKNCVLCGKSGHNPKWCWMYDTIDLWMFRAEELGRCGECLTLFTTDTQNCTNCHTPRVYWKPQNLNGKESRTDNIHTIKKCKTELQGKDTTIGKLNSKISSLENTLESSN